MNNERLKSRWIAFNKARWSVGDEDLLHFYRGAFCVLFLDRGGFGACESEVFLVNFFEDAKDALSFYRFAEIPRILDYYTALISYKGDEKIGPKNIPEQAEYYLERLDEDGKTIFQDLLSEIDRLLIKNSIDSSDLGSFRRKYNSVFEKTNPYNQIIAWGGIKEVLLALMDEIKEQSSKKNSENVCLLEDLLSNGKFDENNKKHLSLAKEFIDSRNENI